MLEPVWCEVNCRACGGVARVRIGGSQDPEYGDAGERTGYIEREFECEETEECAECGAIPDDPIGQRTLAGMYDFACGVDILESGWLRRRAAR